MEQQQQPQFLVKRLVPTAVLPVRKTPHAAGYDLSSSEDYVLPAHGRGVVPTGLALAIPEGYYGRVAPRSSLAVTHGIDTGAGVIDSDYRGPVGVVLFNHSDKEYVVKRGDRIAQLILEKIATPDVTEVTDGDLPETVRGSGGFGSTGK